MQLDYDEGEEPWFAVHGTMPMQLEVQHTIESAGSTVGLICGSVVKLCCSLWMRLGAAAIKPKTQIILHFHNSLNEKNKRRHAPMNYQNSLWPIQSVASCYQSLKNYHKKNYGELLNGSEYDDRIRKKGGGRKSKFDDADLINAFDEIMKDSTAGDPCNENIKYTNLSKGERNPKRIGLQSCIKYSGQDIQRRILKRGK